MGGQRAMEQPAHRRRLKQGGSHALVRWRGIAAPPHGNAWGVAAGIRRLYRIVSCQGLAAKLSAVLSAGACWLGWAACKARRGRQRGAAPSHAARSSAVEALPPTAGRSRRPEGRSRCAAPQGAMTSSRSVLGWPCVRPTKPGSPPAVHAAPPVQMLALTSMHSNASAGTYTC